MATGGEMPKVLNILMLDADGKRIAVKYFDPDMKTVPQQMAFERQIFAKTSRTNARGEAEIALLDKHLVVGFTLGFAWRSLACVCAGCTGATPHVGAAATHEMQGKNAAPTSPTTTTQTTPQSPREGDFASK